MNARGLARSPRRSARYRSLRRTGRWTVAALGTAALATAALGSVASAARPVPASHFSVTASCAVARPGFARCFALLVHGSAHLSLQAAGPAGFHPADLVSAYGLPSTGGATQTVAIVDAYNDPNAEADVNTYRSQFGLPACTTANGCFKKVDQNGGTNYPRNDTGWSQEISLDLDMVSAICPQCHILLVEANSASNASLAKAVDEAAALGANAISNSYGGSEDPSSASHYSHAGVAITASTGDAGFRGGPQSPADYSTVIAVGGTSLRHSTNARGWSESVWSGAGSGCSKIIAKPSWQTDTACAKRTIGDVSAVANPNTGVAVYDSFGAGAGWNVFGGTSVSSPIIAAVYALAANTSSVNDASGLYTNEVSLYDVRKGSNGTCGNYLCKATGEYSGPAGNGTPNGITAF
jgi:subtilase family serine protease